ncbi:IS3 family transposase [Georgenia satyanarayanai]|uniref:IS3 family transposase n=1 Tax=Georgenia satyanarayanai TaxID=860221 RepID=UPI003F7A247F
MAQGEVDAGDRPGTTTSDAQRLAELERENRELRRANAILKRISFFRGGARPPTALIVEFIDDHKDDFGAEPICSQLQVAPSTYYAAKIRVPSVSDAAMLEVIGRVHAENYGVYGVTKVHRVMLRQGHQIARCTVNRLMRGAGSRGISRAKGPRTTMPGAGPDTRHDLVDCDSTATAPNQLWVADITYCRTFAGCLYAAFVTDLFCRRAVGWQRLHGEPLQLAPRERSRPTYLAHSRAPAHRHRLVDREDLPPAPPTRRPRLIDPHRVRGQMTASATQAA